MKKVSRKLLSMLLALVMVVSVMSVSALAADTGYSMTPYDSNVTSLEVTGANVNSYTMTAEPLSENSTNMRVTYNIVLSADTAADASATVNFIAPSENLVSGVPPAGAPQQFVPIIKGNASNTYTVTLVDGVGSKNAYVHKNFPATYQSCDLYVLNVSIGSYKNPIETNGMTLRFGDPAYPNTEPECYMSFEGSGDTYTATYMGSKENYYPDVLTMQADGATKLTASGDVSFATYNADGDKTSYPTITPAINGSASYTVELGTNGGNVTLTGPSGTTTVRFLAPKQAVAAGGTAPTYVNGYLPIGQYASGQAWGSIYSDGAQYSRSTVTKGSTTKITSGMASTGISLGAPGGYVQFEFEDAVQNDPNNKYGIDFVIYGNPFVGNPEAASVQVSSNGEDWYELAGSRYYNDETIYNATLTYTKKSDGVYYSINGGAETPFKAATAWWPEAEDEGYADVAGVGTPFQGSLAASNVTRGTDASGNPTITYSGLNLVKDSDTTDDYLFGYADVRITGSTTDGTACNPYASAPSTGTRSDVGGDGFDISWAVNGNGEPVPLTSIKYVRVYTSAALDPNNLTALPTPGIFGETSAEVCGVFVAKENNGSGEASSDLYVENATTQSAYVDAASSSSAYMNVVPITVSSKTTLNIFSSDDNVFVNGSPISCTYDTPYVLTVSPSAGTTEYYQIITQSGTESPFVTVLKVSN